MWVRVVAVSNEASPGADPDITWALGQLAARGLVASYRVYSIPSRVAELGGATAAQELAELARDVEADVIAFFNTGSCRLTGLELDRVRDAAPGSVWVYFEGDAFQRWIHPFPRAAVPTVRRCQARLVFAGGYLAQAARRAGPGFVTYAPSWVNPERYPPSWRADGDRRHDMVFVGNNVRSRVKPFPGARRRAALVSALQRRYGARLAIYGQGWTGTGAMGPCAIDEVGAIYARSHVCVGIDHTMGPFHFSNRLPIALACGIPLVHSDFGGSAEILPDMRPWQFFNDVQGALAAIDRVLAMDPAEVSELSLRGRRLAESLSCDRVIGYMLDCADSIRNGGDPRRVTNPWLKQAHDRI